MSETVGRLRVSPTALLLGGLILVGLALRLPSFGDALFGDELSTNFVVHGFGIGNVFQIVSSDQEGTPPLYFLLTWVTSRFDGVEGLRLVSLLAGLAAIPLTYLVGLRTVGRPAATVAAALITLAPFQIFYSTEARAYTLVMLFCLLATLTLLIAVEDGSPRWWVAYGLSVAAAMYTHYTAIFVLIVLFVWAFVSSGEARRPLLLATAGAALLYVPWLPEFLQDGDSSASKVIDLLHPFTLAGAKTDIVIWAFGHPLLTVSDLPGRLAGWLIVAGLLLGAAGLVAGLRGARWWPPSRGLVLVVALAAAAPVGAALHQLVAPSVFVPRNLISSWPGLALTLGALVTFPRAGFRVAAVALLLGGFSIGAVRMLDEDYQRPDFAAAREFIERAGEPGAPVVETPLPTPGLQTDVEAAFAPEGDPVPPDRQILPLSFPTLTTRLEARRKDLSALIPLPHPSDRQIARRAAEIAGSGTLFLVVAGTPSLQQLRTYPGPAANFLAALPPRFQEIESRSFPGIGLNAITVFAFKGDGSFPAG